MSSIICDNVFCGGIVKLDGSVKEYNTCYFKDVHFTNKVNCKVIFVDCSFNSCSFELFSFPSDESKNIFTFLSGNFLDTAFDSTDYCEFFGVKFYGTLFEERETDILNANFCDCVFTSCSLNSKFSWGNFRYCNGHSLNISHELHKSLDVFPKERPFYGYKKARYGCVITLEILPDSLVSNGFGRKCRTNKAKVISIEKESNQDSNPVDVAYSLHYPSLKYKVGEVVEVHDFNTNRWVECTTGIHFFVTKEEAMEY